MFIFLLSSSTKIAIENIKRWKMCNGSIHHLKLYSSLRKSKKSLLIGSLSVSEKSMIPLFKDLKKQRKFAVRIQSRWFWIRQKILKQMDVCNNLKSVNLQVKYLTKYWFLQFQALKISRKRNAWTKYFLYSILFFQVYKWKPVILKVWTVLRSNKFLLNN